MKSIFSSLLRHHRLRLDQGLREFARKADVVHSHLAALESGRTAPGSKIATRLADKLGLRGDERVKFLNAALDAGLRKELPTELQDYPASLHTCLCQMLQGAGVPPVQIKNVVVPTSLTLPKERILPDLILELRDGRVVHVEIKIRFPKRNT